MEGRCRRPSRETNSPERVRVSGAGAGVQARLNVKPIKKVQVFYYLTRNGQLEQPHFIEVSHFANNPLRLKDVIDRLSVLRGKAMPFLYSWSCKRNYKNGYVWNDLSENDVINPAEGAEYVLKGSELVEGCSEKLQHIHVSNRQPMPEPNIQLKPRKSLVSPLRELDDQQEFEEYDEVEESEYEDGEKTSSTTPHSRCSRGVSTEELEVHNQTPSDNPKLIESTHIEPKRNLQRFPVHEQLEIEPTPNRNSVLLQLIACGSSAVSKVKNTPSFREPARKTESFRKEKEEDMIKYMSENPRFGNLQSEEKEYFSGSIVESIRGEDNGNNGVESVMKRSNSYNEERRKKVIEEEEEVEEEKKKDEEAVGGGVKGKCIPRMISSSLKLANKKI